MATSQTSLASHTNQNSTFLSATNSPYFQSSVNDPRTSSTQSLRPIQSPGSDRKVLLAVYIHGFLGAEDSFRSFPAHVHNILSVTLVDTHVVHSKIYPRYQSRKNISFARDAFSKWLEPHETETTDVVLIGHSLGGILGAEVVLMPSDRPDHTTTLKHRILGLIAFDTPFLGMHPGVVSTGIASLFRKSPDSINEPNDESTSPLDLLTTTNDPTFNPTFNNDVRLPVRSGKLERAWYFWNKHCGDLRKATQSYFKSHLEFGGCLADYPGLKRRYEALRRLEDVNELKQGVDANGKTLQRVRFVNYYTASTGRAKQEKKSVSGVSNATDVLTSEPASDIDPTALESRHTDSISDSIGSSSTVTTTSHNLALESLRPAPVNPDQYNDVKSLSAAHKEYTLQMKAYEKAVEKHQKAAKKNQTEDFVAEHDSRQADDAKADSSSKSPPKERKFCSLPRKDAQERRDSTWVRVSMEGMDEVVAHTSLFIVGETYTKLVGDTAERIKGWVEEDATIKFLLEDQSQYE